MKVQVVTALALAVLLCHSTDARIKDPDEDRAYEFGFTIEGMQHRHEKKDVNGIIQGEFGFITADGVYHVTVYATDENGNFRILSMKNIKISPPLDGSPDRSSNLPRGDPASPGIVPKSPLVQKRTDVSSTRAPHQPFTTQSTIKPACAGCGYVTTTKKPPIPPPNTYNRFADSQGINNPSSAVSGSVVSNYKGDTDNKLVPNTQTGDAKQNIPYSVNTFQQTGTKNPGPPTFGSPNQNIQTPADPNTVSNRFGEHQLGQNNQSGSPQTSQPSSDGRTSNQEAQNDQSQSLDDGSKDIADRFHEQNEKGNPPGSPQRFSPYSDSFSNPQNSPDNIPGNNKPIQHSSPITYRNPESPVKVVDGVIKIPGNDDIPIKDKYPGMVEGLPVGIEEKDISDILYRFNWTVGFQGHYETGYKNGAKIGGYFVNGSDGFSRVVTYVADEFGYRPKVRLINVGKDSPKTPKDDKTFKLESFEFVWYPVK